MIDIKRKLLIAIFGFLGIMLFLTILSRVVASFSVVEVRAVTPAPQTITHRVEAETIAAKQQEIAIRTEQNQVIDTLYVSAGDWVEAGAALFKVNTVELADSILQLEEDVALIQARINLYSGQIDAAKRAAATPTVPSSETSTGSAEGGEQEDSTGEWQKGQGQADAQVQLPQASADTTANVTELQMQLDAAATERGRIGRELDGLYALRTQDGTVKAPVRAQVTIINLRVGDMTSKNAVLLLADDSAGSRAVFSIPAEQGADFTADTKVTVTNRATKVVLDDVSILSITLSPTDPEILEIATVLPSDTMPIGSTVLMSLVVSSRSYGSCIPLAALHQSANNQMYVYVVDEERTALGTETYARRVNVTVLDQDNKHAALDDGLASGQYVIIETNKIVSESDRVSVIDD